MGNNEGVVHLKQKLKNFAPYMPKWKHIFRQPYYFFRLTFHGLENEFTLFQRREENVGSLV